MFPMRFSRPSPLDFVSGRVRLMRDMLDMVRQVMLRRESTDGPGGTIATRTSTPEEDDLHQRTLAFLGREFRRGWEDLPALKKAPRPGRSMPEFAEDLALPYPERIAMVRLAIEATLVFLTGAEQANPDLQSGCAREERLCYRSVLAFLGKEFGRGAIKLEAPAPEETTPPGGLEPQATHPVPPKATRPTTKSDRSSLVKEGVALISVIRDFLHGDLFGDEDRCCPEVRELTRAENALYVAVMKFVGSQLAEDPGDESEAPEEPEDPDGPATSRSMAPERD